MVRTTSAALKRDDVTVVDVDVHVWETRSALAPYCDQPYRSVLETRNVPPFQPKGIHYPTFPGQFPSRFDVGWTAADLVAGMSEFSIDVAVLFPEPLLSLGSVRPRAYAVSLARAYNRWIADRWIAHEPRLKGAILVFPQEPDEAAKEIDRYARHDGMVGIILPLMGVYPFLGDPRYDPIYETSQRHQLPILYHGGGPRIVPEPWFQPAQLDTWFQTHGYSHSIWVMATLSSLLGHGVPERFPGLKLVFTEAGLSWFPHMMFRMDRVFQDARWDLPMLTESPSTYMKRQMYVATQPVEEPEDMQQLAALIRLIGEDRVLFASDYPHHDFDHPRKLLTVPLDPSAKRKVMGENAAHLLKIPLVVK